MEILAPCGSPGHIRAAVYAGADAVYLGGHGFSARRNALNFSAAEIGDAACFCRGYGVKLYVTVNILTRDNEWDALRSYLAELAAAAPDALIVQDIGVARFCRRVLPDMPLHASTQLSVHTAEGVRFCSELGFERVVIARECDRETLAEIIKKSSIGIEMFVHGALCVSVSGQCGLSAVIGGRSGNRGLCAQPCRLDFSAGSIRHALSLKDLSLVSEIPQLKKMGVCALKIEGRMKRPEYVAAAVRACRRSLDGQEPDMEELRAVFSRSGFTQGYFYNRHKDMCGIRGFDDVSDTASVLPQLSELLRAPSKRVPIRMKFAMEAGRGCVLSVTDDTDTVTVTGDVPQTAVSRETTSADVIKLLSRLGVTPFEASDVKADVEAGLALSASRINDMRRRACDELLKRRTARLTPSHTFCESAAKPVAPLITPVTGPFIRVHCDTTGQAMALESAAAQIVLGIDEAKTVLDAGFSSEKLLAAPGRFTADENKLTYKLTALRESGAEHLLCQNPAHAAIGRRLGYILHGASGLNVFNSETAAFWAEYGLRDITASMELRLPECLAIKCAVPVGVAVYGRLPLMLLRRCPFGSVCETGEACPKFLTDRTNRRFPVRCHGEYQELLNADLLWMADRLSDLRGGANRPSVGFMSLLMSGETPNEALDVLNAYVKGAPPRTSAHTRGLLTRGVE